MGQTLLYRDRTPHTVTGILADVPGTSHLQFDYILPVHSHPWYGVALDQAPWLKFDDRRYTFALLTKGAGSEQLERKLSAYVELHLGPTLFLITGGRVLLVAILTVSYQAIKAAWANPVASLRCE